jgi:flagellar operon protein
MVAEINGIKVPFVPIEQGTGIVKKDSVAADKFSSVFQKELDKLKFSSHAIKRLESRNIQLSENEINKIQDALEKAESKGAKDSLVMMNDTAFIVNIPNKTVVTALSMEDSSENVFTNIDSVVFAR